jgi:hypothetical protein
MTSSSWLETESGRFRYPRRVFGFLASTLHPEGLCISVYFLTNVWNVELMRISRVENEARCSLSSSAVYNKTRENATMEEMFSVWSVPGIYKEDKLCQLLFESCREKWAAVAKAGSSSGTQRKGNIRRWKQLPSNVAEDTSLYMIVTCEV